MGPNVIIALWRNMKLIFDPFVLKVADMTLECSWRCMCTAVWKLHCEHCEEHWTVSWMWYIMSLESIAKTHLLLWHSLAQHSTWTALIVPCETIVVVRHICLYTLVLVVYTMQKHTQPIALNVKLIIYCMQAVKIWNISDHQISVLRQYFLFVCKQKRAFVAQKCLQIVNCTIVLDRNVPTPTFTDHGQCLPSTTAGS